MTKLGNWMLLTILGVGVFAFGGLPAFAGYILGYFSAVVIVLSSLD